MNKTEPELLITYVITTTVKHILLESIMNLYISRIYLLQFTKAKYKSSQQNNVYNI